LTKQNKHEMKKSAKVRLLSFGEVLWDIIEDRSHIGGAAFNLAAHAGRCGLESYLFTSVGADDLGRGILKEMDRLNVSRKYVQTDGKHPTGTVTVKLSATGQPSYMIHKDVAWDFIEARNGVVRGMAAENFNVICFGTLVQREKTSRESLVNVLESLKNIPAFYDVNLRQNYYSRELLMAGLKRTTVLKLNDGEVTVLSDLIFGKNMKEADFVKALLNEYPIKIILVTMGEKGCLVAEKGKVEMLGGHKVKVADTVGAGDAFSAAFLANWLQGKSAVEAAAMGNILGAYVASRSGAIPDYDVGIRELLGLGKEKSIYHEVHSAGSRNQIGRAVTPLTAADGDGAPSLP
jgi:fructokinase